MIYWLINKFRVIFKGKNKDKRFEGMDGDFVNVLKIQANIEVEYVRVLRHILEDEDKVFNFCIPAGEKGCCW